MLWPCTLIVTHSLHPNLPMAYTSKSAAPKPPLKGAFPLDHDAECKPFQIEYMTCLKGNDFMATKCRLESQRYLECRMARELMADEHVDTLGFDESSVKRVDEFNRRIETGDLKVKGAGLG